MVAESVVVLETSVSSLGLPLKSLFLLQPLLLYSLPLSVLRQDGYQGSSTRLRFCLFALLILLRRVRDVVLRSFEFEV